MSRETNAGGHAISGQRIRHRGSLTHHEPVVPTYSRCHVWLERRALDLEDRVRSEHGVKPLVAQQLVAQNRLDGAAGLTPAADDVGRDHDADAGLTRGDRNVPHPAQIAVAVVHEECRSVSERRRVEVGPQTHLLLAVCDGRNIQRARQDPRGSAGIDVPTGFHTATAGRRAAGDPITVRVDIRHALPHDDLLLVGVAMLSAMRASVSIPTRRSRPGLDQSSDSPTFRCGYFCGSRQTTRRPALRSRTLAASPAMPAPIIATSCPSWLTRAAYRKREPAQATLPRKAWRAVRHSAMEDLCPGVPSGSYSRSLQYSRFRLSASASG